MPFSQTPNTAQIQQALTAPRRSEGLFRRALRLLLVWQQRAHDRSILARLNEHDRIDMGLTTQQIAIEVRKPLWRA